MNAGRDVRSVTNILEGKGGSGGKTALGMASVKSTAVVVLLRFIAF